MALAGCGNGTTSGGEGGGTPTETNLDGTWNLDELWYSSRLTISGNNVTITKRDPSGNSSMLASGTLSYNATTRKYVLTLNQWWNWETNNMEDIPFSSARDCMLSSDGKTLTINKNDTDNIISDGAYIKIYILDRIANGQYIKYINSWGEPVSENEFDPNSGHIAALLVADNRYEIHDLFLSGQFALDYTDRQKDQLNSRGTITYHDDRITFLDNYIYPELPQLGLEDIIQYEMTDTYFHNYVYKIPTGIWSYGKWTKKDDPPPSTPVQLEGTWKEEGGKVMKFIDSSHCGLTWPNGAKFTGTYSLEGPFFSENNGFIRFQWEVADDSIYIPRDWDWYTFEACMRLIFVDGNRIKFPYDTSTGLLGIMGSFYTREN